MARPFFTIAIPAKNRPDRLANAVRSVLGQTFRDFELIVCDNSDDSEVGKTQAVVRSFDDDRIRYVRTNGRLSMPDNWERAVLDATGEYVGILTDRSVFKPRTLEIAHREVERSGSQVLCWLAEHFGRDAAGRQYRRRVCSRQSYEFESRVLLDYFLHGHPKYATKVVPKLMTSVCRRDIIDTVRASAVGRICPPVCPDYTSGFLMLGHSRTVMLIDQPLFILCGSGNGSAFRRRGPLADRFRADLGMTWRDLVDRMPSEACFTQALILNDFMRIKDALPERYADFQFDRLQYYLGCFEDYTRTARVGTDRTEDLDALVEALNAETADVQQEVRSRQVYVASVLVNVRGGQDSEVEDADEPKASKFPEFASVFEAMAWEDANPVPPRPTEMAMPGLEVFKSRRMRKRRQRHATDDVPPRDLQPQAEAV